MGKGKITMNQHSVKVVVLAAMLALTFLSSPLQVTADPSPTVAPQASSGWELVTSPASATMYTLDMIDASNGWSGGMAGFMFYYDGTGWWGNPTSFQYVINGIDMVSGSLGWGVTWQGRMIKYDGSSWWVHSQPAKSSLDDLFMLSASDGWAVGGIGENGKGTILRYNPGADAWQAVSSPVSAWLKAIDMVNANDGWIVGISGTFVHWNGSTWQGASLFPGVALMDVDMVSSTDGWAVGSTGTPPDVAGVIYHYNGTSWSQEAKFSGSPLHAVSMVSSNEGWAVGDGGTILHFWNGTWTPVASPTDKALYAIQMLSPTDGWAMGKDGVILRYRGVYDLSSSIKRVNPRHATAGQRLTYTIQVSNTGTIPAPAVTVTDPIPPGTVYVPGSASTTRGTVQSTNPLVVAVGDLPSGESALITFQVDIPPVGGLSNSGCGFIINDAVIGVEGTQITRRAATSIGDCYESYLPLSPRRY